MDLSRVKLTDLIYFQNFFVDPLSDQQPDESYVCAFGGDSKDLWLLINFLLIGWNDLALRIREGDLASKLSGNLENQISVSEWKGRYVSDGKFLSALEALLYRRLACENGISLTLNVAIRNYYGIPILVTYPGEHRKLWDVMVKLDPALSIVL